MPVQTAKRLPNENTTPARAQKEQQFLSLLFTIKYSYFIWLQVWTLTFWKCVQFQQPLEKRLVSSLHGISFQFICPFRCQGSPCLNNYRGCDKGPPLKVSTVLLCSHYTPWSKWRNQFGADRALDSKCHPGATVDAHRRTRGQMTKQCILIEISHRILRGQHFAESEAKLNLWLICLFR